MSKSINPTPSQIDYMKQKLAEVAKDREHRPSDDEIAQILLDLGSPTLAVRGSCTTADLSLPSGVGNFRTIAQSSQEACKKDPDPTVRALALHVEQDADQIASLEAMRDLLEEEDRWARSMETTRAQTK